MNVFVKLFFGIVPLITIVKRQIFCNCNRKQL